MVMIRTFHQKLRDGCQIYEIINYYIDNLFPNELLLKK